MTSEKAYNLAKQLSTSIQSFYTVLDLLQKTRNTIHVVDRLESIYSNIDKKINEMDEIIIGIELTIKKINSYAYELRKQETNAKKNVEKQAECNHKKNPRFYNK